MSPAPVTVYLASQLVVRESDGETLLLVEAHGGDPDRPILVEVIDPGVEEAE